MMLSSAADETRIDVAPLYCVLQWMIFLQRSEARLNHPLSIKLDIVFLITIGFT